MAPTPLQGPIKIPKLRQNDLNKKPWYFTTRRGFLQFRGTQHLEKEQKDTGKLSVFGGVTDNLRP